MSNYYGQAIKKLESDMDYRSVVFAIAAKHPKVFLDAYYEVHMNKVDTIKEQVLDTIRKNSTNGTSKLVAGVKAYRTLTGASLRDAKNAVQELIHNE